MKLGTKLHSNLFRLFLAIASGVLSLSLSLSLSFLSVQSVQAEDRVIDVLLPNGRTAEDLVNALRPFLAPDGELAVVGERIVVKTTPSNLIELKNVVAGIDVRIRQIRILTRTRDRHREEKNKAATGLKVTSNGQSRMVVTGSEAEQRAAVDAVQELRLSEGGRGVFRAIGREFKVIPRITGRIVRLAIESQSQKDYQSTEISLSPGHWFPVRGFSEVTSNESRSVASRAQASHESQEELEIQVEIIQ